MEVRRARRRLPEKEETMAMEVMSFNFCGRTQERPGYIRDIAECRCFKSMAWTTSMTARLAALVVCHDKVRVSLPLPVWRCRLPMSSATST